MAIIPPNIEHVVFSPNEYEDITYNYLFELAFRTSKHAHGLRFPAELWDFSFTDHEAEMFFRGDLMEKIDPDAMNIVPVSTGTKVKFCWLIYWRAGRGLVPGHLRTEGRQCSDFVQRFQGRDLRFFINLDNVISFVR